MIKSLFGILFGLMLFTNQAFCSEHILSISGNYKQLDVLPITTYNLGYEVIFMPSISLFYKYGTTSLTRDMSTFNDHTMGLRYYLPVSKLYFGFGYGVTNIDFKDSLGVKGDGEISGLFIEVGREFLSFLGFSGVGMKLNAMVQFAEVKIKSDNEVVKFLDLLSSDDHMFFSFGVELSYKF